MSKSPQKIFHYKYYVTSFWFVGYLYISRLFEMILLVFPLSASSFQSRLFPSSLLIFKSHAWIPKPCISFLIVNTMSFVDRWWEKLYSRQICWFHFKLPEFRHVVVFVLLRKPNCVRELCYTNMAWRENCTFNVSRLNVRYLSPMTSEIRYWK